MNWVWILYGLIEVELDIKQQLLSEVVCVHEVQWFLTDKDNDRNDISNFGSIMTKPIPGCLEPMVGWCFFGYVLSHDWNDDCLFCQVKWGV